MVILFVYFLFSLFVAAYANLIKRSGFAWFFISLIFSPLLAFVALIVLGRPTLPGLLAGLNLKKCPQCAEKVKKGAKVCRFCGHEFEAPSKSIPIIDVPELFESDMDKEDIPPLAKRFRNREEYERWRDEKMKSLKK